MNPQFFRAYKLPLILLAVNLLLAAVLFAEWQFYSGYEDRLTAMLQQKHQTAGLFAKLPDYKTSLAAEEDYHKIVDQPLFIEGRQPVENTELTQRNSAQNPTAQVTKPSVRLTGVILIPDALVALLQDNMGKNFRVKQGETIQGWDVDSIQNDKITITNGVDHQDVLLREPKPVKKHPGANAPSPSQMNGGMNPQQPPQPPEYVEPEPEPELEPESEAIDQESEDE